MSCDKICNTLQSWYKDIGANGSPPKLRRGTTCRLRINDASNDAVIATPHRNVVKKLRGGRCAFSLSFVEVAGKARPGFHFVYFTVNTFILADGIILVIQSVTHCFRISLAQVISFSGGAFKLAPTIPSSRPIRHSRTI